ncbi:Ribophorin I [Carpediemonas membranifera]|uniref:Dolichyl-diphosphooligosaccharide--protein glycosyltransferase subunit 1 n=1 Tax=Carpediemonas membranifera TaxID=201153 RepID=A0A8J6AWX5_9EUKA|nr:Ribophorin I [Carpediemonas membranifera]|eukprot:KAG9396901.1 Ribophorin I [Carpediemonas membranifera]
MSGKTFFLVALLVCYVIAIPPLVADYYEKTVSVTPSGRVLVNSHYKLRNDAPESETPFSRLDYSMSYDEQQKSIPGMTLILPMGVSNIKYFDRIGNITSSSVRAHGEQAVEVSVLFRYPLMGGWKTDLNITYEMPGHLLATSGPNHAMQATVVDKVVPEIHYKHLVSHVTFPQGSSRTAIDFPEAIGRAPKSHDSVPAFMDWRPRPRMTVRVDELTNGNSLAPMTVSYFMPTTTRMVQYAGIASIGAMVVLVLLVIKKLWNM